MALAQRGEAPDQSFSVRMVRESGVGRVAQDHVSAVAEVGEEIAKRMLGRMDSSGWRSLAARKARADMFQLAPARAPSHIIELRPRHEQQRVHRCDVQAVEVPTPPGVGSLDRAQLIREKDEGAGLRY